MSLIQINAQRTSTRASHEQGLHTRLKEMMSQIAPGKYYIKYSFDLKFCIEITYNTYHGTFPALNLRTRILLFILFALMYYSN